jgi:hypothetical protein
MTGLPAALAQKPGDGGIAGQGQSRGYPMIR